MTAPSTTSVPVSNHWGIVYCREIRHAVQEIHTSFPDERDTWTEKILVYKGFEHEAELLAWIVEFGKQYTWQAVWASPRSVELTLKVGDMP